MAAGTAAGAAAAAEVGWEAAMGEDKAKISPDEWKARLEANRRLRVQYAEDPSKLTEDEKTRAMVLLQRDQRKVRQQQEKKKRNYKNKNWKKKEKKRQRTMPRKMSSFI